MKIVDVYKLTYWYLTLKPDGGLTLRRWVSEPLADSDQIEDITAVDGRTERCCNGSVRSRPTTARASSASSSCGTSEKTPDTVGTLRHIRSNGNMYTSPRNGVSWQLRADALKSTEIYLRGHDDTVATNQSPAQFGACRFAQPDNNGEGFPHGFEVEVIGPPSSRRVITHLTPVIDRRDTIAVASDQTLVSFFSGI